jgi:hypothetical protein
MFKYNELSDLIDGRLVIPLHKTEDGQVHVRASDSYVEFDVDFDDFDFDKLPEERGQTTPPDPVDPVDPPEPEPEPEKDDADYDGTDIPNDDIVIPEEPEEEERERWLTKDEAEKLAKSAGLSVKNGKIRGYKYII